jgi:hypothetical protein
VKTVSPFRFGQYFRVLCVIFIGLTILLAIITAISPTTIAMIKIFLAANIFLSIVLSFFYYKNRYHILFSYDENGFMMKTGMNENKALWSEFDAVSLVHVGYGDLIVRVYHEQDFFDIPASALKLDASSLRFEIMEYLKKGSVKNE